MSDEFKRNITIMRSMNADPKVTELVYAKRINAVEYSEIFPSHLGEMLNWLAGTQRVVVDFTHRLTGSDPAVLDLRTALYQSVEDLYPGGLRQFTRAFPPAEYDTEQKV